MGFFFVVFFVFVFVFFVFVFVFVFVFCFLSQCILCCSYIPVHQIITFNFTGKHSGPDYTCQLEEKLRTNQYTYVLKPLPHKAFTVWFRVFVRANVHLILSADKRPSEQDIRIGMLQSFFLLIIVLLSTTYDAIEV